MRNEPILEVQELRVEYGSGAGRAEVVRGVGLALYPGRTLALVGESSCGKSTVAAAILRLMARRGHPEEGRYSAGGCILSGQILFAGRDLMRLSEEEMQRVRGAGIALLFQEPATALNPVVPVLDQVAEVVEYHAGAGKRDARRRAAELFEQFGLELEDAGRRVFAHQLSGGMRQRVLFAMALAAAPLVLIADEPTASLDVTVQAEILARVREIQRETELAVLWISHDLSVVAQCSDEVALMYAGRIVELTPTADWLREPRHPYGALLQAAVPYVGGDAPQSIPGAPPDFRSPPSGCRFHPRCPVATGRCGETEPALAPMLTLSGPAGARVACYHPRGEVSE